MLTRQAQQSGETYLIFNQHTNDAKYGGDEQGTAIDVEFYHGTDGFGIFFRHIGSLYHFVTK